ncbi:ABC transporter substrate-binding protein [Pararhizobium mangrovi]|uniref:ABC transporter substrate-binding protein n=1 Tax=Pararhizobium mangrovi TaxID=2590452 RepID=A0A506UAY2_9HYPH|nr:ABC transporter substrate-binding protein [Pararhizobium mangrovi]TPW30214.1 ABC transporter substrate-binding protein [Pararhizobium mangrovi]
MQSKRSLFLAGAALTCFLVAAPASRAAEFDFAGPLDAYTLDPHAISNTLVFAILRNVYEPLVARGKDLSIEPVLATKWKQVDDKTWEFDLRKDVKFSNGNAFNADDVVFSFDRAKKGGMSSHLADIDSIEKVDDYTVRLKTHEIDPILPNQIVNWFMMDSDWAKEHGAVEPGQADNSTEGYANQHAMGTGPYVISQRDPGVKTVFSANKTWWNTIDGNVDKAIFYVIPNPSTRVSALISGEVDMIDGVPPQDASRIEKADGLHIASTPDLRTVYLQPDVARDTLVYGGGVKGNPFKNPKVREAMKLAIDTGAIQKRIMRGYSTPVGLPIANEVNGSTAQLDAPNKPDLDKAKALMKEAGYADGFDVTLDCTNDRFINDQATCLAIGSFLSRIDIRVTPRIQTTARWAQQINPPGYDTSFAMLSYSPYTYDAHQFLSGLAKTRDPKTGAGVFNIGGYSNKEVDRLTDEIGAETDTKKRTELLHKALGILKKSNAYIPIHQLQILWGVRDGVNVVQLADLSYPLAWFKVPE